MLDIAAILGADKIRAEKELKESLDFEMKLANVSLHKISKFIQKFNNIFSKYVTYPTLKKYLLQCFDS